MLTRDEAELYDRQIRLWGVNAQSRIRQSKVLMLGFGGLASEVAKILILAGIDTLSVVDDQQLTPHDITSNLFCRPQTGSQYRTHELKEKLYRLNPLVKVNIYNKPIGDIENLGIEGYDLVTLTSFLAIDQISSLNKICRQKGAKFYLVLDYGYFGFMFNDLGPVFEFSHEVFSEIETNNNIRASGEKADPISVEDDAPSADDNTADSLDDNDYSSDDDDVRPKKRRRLHSPERPVVAKTGNEKKTQVETLNYVPFYEMISSRSHNCTSSTSPSLFTSMAVLEYYDSYGRFPNFDTNDKDSVDYKNLVKHINQIENRFNIDEKVMKKLDPNWHKYIFGSLSPVCAVLGGVAGQDMIRALSGKDIPIHNTFSFDGMSMIGIVEKFGLTSANLVQPKPIVRDLIQIDDD